MWVHGSIAYTCQDPWIQNKTVRENILWGRPYDEETYLKTLKVCELEQDMKVRSLPSEEHHH